MMIKEEEKKVNVNNLSNVINNNKIKVLNLVNQSVDKFNFIGKLIKEKVLNYKNYNNLGVNSFDINIDHSGLKNIKKESPIEVSNGAQIIQDKELFDLYEINKRIGKIRVDQMMLNIVTWNLQTLNKDDNQFKKKKQFIFDVLTEVKPDIFFLIDVGKLGNELNFPNYIRFDDKRNFLYKSAVIQDNIMVEEGIFYIPTLDLNFVYVRPNNEKKEIIEKVRNLLIKNCTVIGDLNLKSNETLRKICEAKQIMGEMTLQTVIVKDNLKNTKVELFNGLSDHKVLVLNIERRVTHTGWKKLEKIDEITTEDTIKEVFEKGKSNIKLTLKPVVRIKSFDNTKDIVNKIIDAIMSNDMAFQFKLYEKLWLAGKKEPFLGTWIPNSVVESLKKHYWHNDSKKYVDIPKVKINCDLLKPKSKSFSNAGNADNFILNRIDNALFNIWTELEESNEKECAIKNFLESCNKVKENLAFETFFLKKSKDKLDSVNDIRIISIVPIWVKIWESLIYDTVVDYISNIINKEFKYQFGGVTKGSTFECIYQLQKIYDKTNSTGLLFIDITKGYDSVEWDILEQDIVKLENTDVRNLLLVWLALVRNCDARVNNGMICKSRGLGMGLSLAPVLFVFYVHNGLIESKLGLDILIMYVDDLTIAINNKVELYDKIKYMIDVFKKRGLYINPKKCAIISNDDSLIKLYQNMDIEIVSRQRYLGVNLRLTTTNNVVADSRIYKINKGNISIPRFVAIALKRRIYEGAIFAKIRFSCMMVALRNKVERERFWRNFMYIMKQDYWKLSYVQLILILGNWFRIFFDMKDLDIIKNEVDKIPMMENRIAFANDYIKKRLQCGIKQIDDPLSSFVMDMDDPLLWNTSMNCLKSLVNSIYIQFKKHIIKVWKIEKEKEKVKINSNVLIWVENKLFRNFKVVQNIVLRHFPENVTWISFITIVFAQINIRIKLSKEILDTFNNTPIFMWGSDKVDIKWFEIAYLKLDEYLQNIIVYTMDKKCNYKDIAQICLLLDYISSNNIWKNKNVEDLVYVLNLKLNLKDYLSDKMLYLLQKESDVYYDEIDSSPNFLNYLFSVDGSYSDLTKQIGSGIFVRYYDGIWKEEFFYSTIISKYDKERNITGEVFAIVKALEIANERNWKVIHIIFDYIGLIYWALGLWSCNSALAVKYKKVYKELTENLVVYWHKVKSHTDVKYNDYADSLAKYGTGLNVVDFDPVEVGQSTRI